MYIFYNIYMYKFFKKKTMYNLLIVCNDVINANN